MNASIKEGKPFFSFEFFPPRTDEVRGDVYLVLLYCNVVSATINLSVATSTQAEERGFSPLPWQPVSAEWPSACLEPDLSCCCSTRQGVENLFDRQDRMASYGPTFCDITWGAGGSTAELTLEIASKMQNVVSLLTMYVEIRVEYEHLWLHTTRQWKC